MDVTEGARLRVFLDRFYPRREGGIEKLAEEAGLRRGTLYPWFNGTAEPDLKSLAALSEALTRKAGRPVSRAEILAAIDGFDLEADRRARIAEEVEAAVAPLRGLLRDAGLLQGAGAPSEEPHGAPR
jgi:transcriptional regulator with XRE-family HTH domain